MIEPLVLVLKTKKNINLFFKVTVWYISHSGGLYSSVSNGNADSQATRLLDLVSMGCEFVGLFWMQQLPLKLITADCELWISKICIFQLIELSNESVCRRAASYLGVSTRNKANECWTRLLSYMYLTCIIDSGVLMNYINVLLCLDKNATFYISYAIIIPTSLWQFKCRCQV